MPPAMPEPGASVLLGVVGQPLDATRLPVGLVEKREGDRYLVEFEAGQASASSGDEATVHYQVGDVFSEQRTRIEAVEETGALLILTLQPLAEPTPAEARRSARIQTVASDLTAVLAGASACPLLDISGHGCAILSDAVFEVDTELEVELTHAGTTHRGRATVRSRAELWEGRYRYGLECAEEDADGLRAGLAVMMDELGDE